MALKAILAKIEDAGDAAKFYREVEEDGAKRYVLDVEATDGFALENVSGLKSALERRTAEAREAKTQAEGFKGLDAKSVRDALTELEDLRKSNNDANAIAESKVRQLAAKHGEEKKALGDEISRVKSVLDATLRQEAAIRAITAAGGNASLLLPHVMSQTRMREDGGRFIVDVVNAEGVARIKDANSNMSIDDLVQEMRASKDFSVAFAAPTKTGSGTRESGITHSGAPKSLSECKTDEDKVAFYRARMAAQG